MKKPIRIIVGGMIFVFIVAIVVFASMNRYMDNETRKDVQEISDTYLAGVAEEEMYHFESVADIRFHQAQRVLDDAIMAGNDIEVVKRSAERNASFQRLTSCAFILEDGTFDAIYGDDVISVDDPDYLMESVLKGNRVVTGGDSETERIVLWVLPADLELADGNRSVAFACCRPMSQFIEKMHLDADGTLAYFHIIYPDGNYVVENSDSIEESFSDRILQHDTVDGMSAEECVEEFKAHMEAGEDYSFHNVFNDTDNGISERRSILAQPMADTNWYLVSVIPYGVLDKTIDGMGMARTRAMYIGIAIIAACLLLVFALYANMTRRQMKAVEEARDKAEEAMIEAETASEEAIEARRKAEDAMSEWEVACDESTKAKQAAEQAREEAEEAREEAIAANKAKSEFLSNMSHDIRTPMNAIMGMTAIAKDHIDDKDRVQDCLRKISLSGKQLLGLINDVLDMSKIESGKMTLNLEALSLRQTMETMCDIIRPQLKSNDQQFDIYISNIISEEVYCDSVRLNQVLLNFLSNAMKFTPQGGKISLGLRQEKSPKGDKYVRTHLDVKDNGMGMSAEFKEKLFTAFEREDNRRVHKTQGTGLGLTITKYIIEAMGGTIEVESEPGEGTDFHVIVDLEKVSEKDKEMKLPDWKILIVDDNEEVCKTAELSLRELGTRPEWCLGGEKAIEMVTEAHEKGEDYFAVLIDYKMHGLNGIETSLKIREKYGDSIPISIISAYDWNEIEDEASKAGISGFISKPLFKSTLYHELRKFIGDEEEELLTSEEDEDIDLNGLKVLLAEDQDINAEIVKTILGTYGAIVDHAEDGKIVTEMFAGSEEGYYDVILMDLRMPNMNGYEATGVIRSMKRSDAADIPIFAMTADAFAEDAQKCYAAGMNEHIAKPIDLDILKRTLAKYISK
ncbi:MAG: response regulator [Lachnospiraceae bacterium]|nr:response regulator [Lachnospiraceae bacterium]